ncbi:hypothetical protein HMPREF1981_01919 [Bacteroides pyogenes F0041]|uniref:Uncharacterized protein n=1 Tax=Bacteroides pyogenes F0041 TaxID=1321819 RepID=U2DUC5_9BACE|nr:hypothetical protein HMPREF1981_01919 [Bacteroides pyogenes F0041]GAE21364.1 hypothetical protein JCM10003_802 [Bacteroides pyogenes JCM 10003]
MHRMLRKRGERGFFKSELSAFSFIISYVTIDVNGCSCSTNGAKKNNGMFEKKARGL